MSGLSGAFISGKPVLEGSGVGFWLGLIFFGAVS